MLLHRPGLAVLLVAFDPATAQIDFAGAFGVDVDVARGRVYVADSVRGLVILGEVP